MANISPSYIQQYALLSQLYHNFKSFTYFFPSYETCSINVNTLFHAAIKNLHVKANGVFVFLLLHHPPLFTTTISEGITHTRKNTFLRQKQKQPSLTCYIYIYICIHDQPRAMNDKEGWQVRVREFSAVSAT